MAATLRREGVVKLVLSAKTHFASIPPHPARPLLLSFLKTLISTQTSQWTHNHSHSSMCKKNPDDPGNGMVVPDKPPKVQSEDYWIPHPETGVFVPPTDQDGDVGTGSLSEESVLKQQAFFRPSSIEDPEKPVSLESLEVEVEVHSDVAETDASPLPVDGE